MSTYPPRVIAISPAYSRTKDVAFFHLAGEVQRRVTILVRGRRLRAMFQKQLHACTVALACGPYQRSIAIVILRLAG